MRNTTCTAFFFYILAFFTVFAFLPMDAAAKGGVPQEKAESKQPLQISQMLDTSGGRAMFRFNFSKPMVDIETVNTAKILSAEELPFTFYPAITGEARWLDTMNIAFVGYDKLARATTYIIKPKMAITAPSGEKYSGGSFTFTPYPFYYRATQVRYSVDGTVTLEINFSAKVNLARLKASLVIENEQNEKLPLEIVPEKDESLVSRVRAMVKPEKLGKLILRLPENFLSEEGPEALGKERNLVKVETTSMFAINTVRARQSSSPPWERYIEIRTTNAADMDKVGQYLDITPATDFSIVARSNGFHITGDFITRPRVGLTFKKGMPGLVGTLLEDFTSTVAFDDFSPNMAFDTEGTILSPNRSMRVPISSINVEKIQATLWQLPENNIPLMAMGFFDSYKKSLSRKIAVRTGTVNAVYNRSNDFSLNLTQLAGKAKGVFLLTVADASDPTKVQSDEPREDGYYYEDYNDGIASPMEKLVVISDIGITARVMPDGITVWANSIATAEALQNARVCVYSHNNVLMAEGKTGKDGLWRHDHSSDWAPHERPAIVVVSTPTTEPQPKAEAGLAKPSVEDIAYLKLDIDLASDSSFDTGGRNYVRQGYEAFCFTPRGVFRPGETVDFKVMVRNALMQAPEEFPIAWEVRSSVGRVVGRGTSKLSSAGGAGFSLPLVPSSPTGRYTMSVSVPGQNGSIGFCAFAVEDFQPPRIEVNLTPEKDYVVNQQVSIDVDASYLFGAPAADAPWESEITAVPRFFSHTDWRSFYFPSYSEKPMPDVRIENSGTLDDKGKTTLTISPDDDWTDSILDVVATVRVREDGGRWVARNLTVPYYKHPFFLGYEYPREEILAGAPFSMRFAAVTPEGKTAEVSELSVTVERRETYYARSDMGYTESTRYVPINTEKVALTDGLGTFTFTPPRQAAYRIKASAGDVITETDVHVWSGLAGTDDGASPLVDRLQLSWERQKHSVGETAILKVRSPFAGKLLIILEGEKEIYRLILPMTETEMAVPVPVMSSMLPNAYCSAWVIRPVKEDERWGAHRAYGIIPMLIDRTESKLEASLTAPAEALPKSEIPITVTLKDANGKPVQGEVALALVDEGLLSLTNYKTPDPFAFFTAKRAMLGRNYDLYEQLMPLSSRQPISLLPGGGAFMAEDSASRMSPITRKLEMLSIFLGSITTDSSGTCSTTLKLPEYSGRGRIMAIAADRIAVGSTDKGLLISRDMTVEATAPRMVAPGDVFAMPVIAFGDGKKALKASVSIETEGPLDVEGQNTFSIALDETTAKVPLNLNIRALDASGLGAVRIVTSIEGEKKSFDQRLEIPVRPPFPRLTRSGSGLIKGGESATIDVGAGFFPGTQQVALSFSDTPGIGLMRALDYLRSYPYGCLEQTTSSAWPYLAVPAMLKSIDPEKAKDSEFRQGLDYAIRRIISMQRADGGFNGWPGVYASSAYAWVTAYATHFLTEARNTGLVPEDALKPALSWMRSYLSSSLPDKDWAIRDALSVKAYICYVLALNGDAPLGWMQFLKDQGKYLSQSARIFLAGAYTVATGKTDALKEFGTLPIARPDRYGWSLESSPRNEALRLLMWANADPFAPETALLAKRVMNEGNAGRWRSTQENAMAVMGIGRYIEKTAGPSSEFTATLTFLSGSKDTTVELAKFTNKDKLTISRKDLPPADPEAPVPVTASITGEGTAYYSWTTSGVPMEAPAPFAEGIKTMRRWVLPDGTVYDFIPDENGNLPETLRYLKIPNGTRITVTLYVKPEAAMNSLVLADIVPGGFEIDNPNLAPGSEYAAKSGTFVDPKTGKPFPHPEGYKNSVSLNGIIDGRTEMRDDRLLLFIDYMPSQPSAFTYTLRAVNKGEFVLPPLSAEDMYDPSIRAMTHTAKVNVE